MKGLLTADSLMEDSRLKTLSKADRDFALGFLDELAKGRTRAAATPVVKDWSRLMKADPDFSAVHVSTELTDLSVAYFQDQAMFQAAAGAEIPVKAVAGQYNIYDRGDLFRINADDARRGPASESAGSGFKVTQGNYSCNTYAWHKDVDEQLMAQQQAGDPVDDALAYVTQVLMMIREKVFAANCMGTGIWGGTDQTGVSGAPGANQFKQWDLASSTPREDLTLQALNIHQATGFWPNALIISPFVLRGLLLNSEIVSAFQYTTAGAVPDLVALAKCLFANLAAHGVEIPKVLIAGGTATTSAEGATDAFSYIVGKVALLAYLNPRPGLRSPSAYYTFSWAGLLGANAFGGRIKDFEIETLAVPHRVEGEMSFDIRVVANALGRFFTSAVS